MNNNDDEFLTMRQRESIILNCITDALHKVTLFKSNDFDFVIKRLFELKNEVRVKAHFIEQEQIKEGKLK